MTRRNMRHYASPAIGLGVVCATLAGLLGLHAKSQTAVKRETATSRSIPVVEAQVLGGKLNEGSQNDEEGDASSRGSWAAVPSSVKDTIQELAFEEAVDNTDVICFSNAVIRLGLDQGTSGESKYVYQGDERNWDEELIRNSDLTEDQKALGMNSTKIITYTNKLPFSHNLHVQSFDEFVSAICPDTKPEAGTDSELYGSQFPVSDAVARLRKLAPKNLEDLKVIFAMRSAGAEVVWGYFGEKVIVDGLLTRYVNNPEAVVYSQKNRAFFRYGMCALPFELEKLVYEYAYGTDEEQYFPAVSTLSRLVKDGSAPMPFIYFEKTKDSCTVIKHKAKTGPPPLRTETGKLEFPNISTIDDLESAFEKLKKEADISDEFKLVVGIFRIPDLEQGYQPTCVLLSDSDVFDDRENNLEDDTLLGSKLSEIGNDSKKISDVRCILVPKAYFELAVTKFKASLALLQKHRLFDDDFRAKDHEIVEKLVAAAKEIPLE